MEDFVNREDEIALIGEAFNALHNRQSLLRTPIIEFYGVGGIGKTVILKKVQEKCIEERLSYIWADARQNPQTFLDTMLEQVGNYAIQKSNIENGKGDLSPQFIGSTKTLLKREPLVILMDSLDSASQDQLNWIEAMMHDLVESGKLFSEPRWDA